MTRRVELFSPVSRLSDQWLAQSGGKCGDCEKLRQDLTLCVQNGYPPPLTSR